MTTNITAARNLGTLVAVMQRIRQIASNNTRVSNFENAVDFAGMTSHHNMQQCLNNLIAACTERWLPFLERSGYDIDKLTQEWCVAVVNGLAQVSNLKKLNAEEAMHYHQAIAVYRATH